MKGTSAPLLAQLYDIRDSLLQPGSANLDALSPRLESVIAALGLTKLSSQEMRLLQKLVRQVTRLHEQAGKIRYGMARRALADSAGYTSLGEATPASPSVHLSLQG